MHIFSVRTVLGGVVAIALALLAVPYARAQSSASTGRLMTDFVRTVAVAGFDSANGQLVAADITLMADLDSRVLEITNNSASAADFAVTTNVRFCADLGPAPANYLACDGAASASALAFQTQVLSESFLSLAAGASAASAASVTASDIGSVRVVDAASLARLTDVGQVEFGIATLAGFEAFGGGGNSLVQIETFASLSAEISYVFAGISVDKRTNGGDGVAVTAGTPINWTYDVTNTGNTVLQEIVVTDDKEGSICTIALLDAGQTERCTTSGTAGSSDYANIATVVGVPAINQDISVTDDDPSSYTVVVPTPVPSPTPVATETVPSPNPTPAMALPSEAMIDIELSTNGVDADLPPGVSLQVDDAIVWNYVVTNTGIVDLYNIVVNDDLVGGVCRATVIRVGGQTSCTLGGIAVEGAFGRVGDVIGESIAGQRVVDSDPTHHIVTDEVLGITTVPDTVLPGSPASPPVPVTQPNPDEVLAYTGGPAGTRASLGGVLLFAGAGLVAASVGVRRRKPASSVSG